MLPDMSLVAQAASPLQDALLGLFGFLPEGAQEPTTVIVSALLKATAIVLVIQVAMLYATWLERKVIGRMQDRIGPNRVGRYGLAQPFADMVKILTKENITPTEAHGPVYNLGAILIVPPAIIGFAVIAWSQSLVPADLSVGILFFFAVASTAVVPIFMAGWASRNKYALIGAMRAIAQIVSYEIPQVLSLVGVLLIAGTLSATRIIVLQGPIQLGLEDGGLVSQALYPGVWFVFLQPVAFVIFLLATTAEIERTPFDIPEAESEIIAGYHTEYSGIRFGMFYLALYFATIAAAAIGAILFLGGWQPPFPTFWMSEGAQQIAAELGWLWMALKTAALVLVFMWFRGTLPRLRADQLMGFAWKVLVPLSLLNLLITAIVNKLIFPYGATPPEPWVVALGFLITNLFLVAVLVMLLMRFRRASEAREVRFDTPVTVASGGQP